MQAVEGDTDPTQKVDVDGSLDDLDVEAVDAVVVPGGTVNADQLRIERAGAGRSCARSPVAGKPVAVICHGPWLLVSAGLVGGPPADVLPLARRGRPQRRRAPGSTRRSSSTAT